MTYWDWLQLSLHHLTRSCSLVMRDASSQDLRASYCHAVRDEVADVLEGIVAFAA